jgi:thiopeptide-type bacteriocin biosynthesis protein
VAAQDFYVGADFFTVRICTKSLEWLTQLGNVGEENSMDPYHPSSREALNLDPQLIEAIAIASPSLYHEVSRIDSCSEKAKNKTKGALLRYAIRMTTRPTPFGSFGGVAVGRASERTSVKLSANRPFEMRCYADAAWLVQARSADKSFTASLGLRTAENAYEKMNRVYLAATSEDQQSLRRASVAATRVVRAVLDAAQNAQTREGLLEIVLQEEPLAPPAQAQGLVDQLASLGFLIPARSGMPKLSQANRPLSDAALADGITSSGVDGSDIFAVMNLLKDTPGLELGTSLGAIQALERQQRLITPGFDRPTIQVNTRANLDGATLSHAVFEAAADAAQALMVLSTKGDSRAGHLGHLDAYHGEYVARYGQDTEIPLLELLDADHGLDAPASYIKPNSLRASPAIKYRPPPAARDDLVENWLIEALLAGDKTIEITDERLNRARETGDTYDQSAWADLVEIPLQILARSPEAVDRGDFTAVLSPLGFLPGGLSTCRFYESLAAADVSRLATYMRSEEQVRPEVIFAELNYAPSTPRMENVTTHPLIRSWELVVNQAPRLPSDRVIRLRDIVIGVDGRGFYARSLRHDAEVIATQSNLLNTYTAPNAVRFLFEIGRLRLGRRPALDLAGSERAPYFPRVTRRNVILQPAQWHLDPGMWDGTGGGPGFDVALNAWRSRLAVPQRVVLCNEDMRIRLDLGDADCVQELRHRCAQITKGPTRALLLQETLDTPADHWVRDGAGGRHVAEFVVPLSSRRCRSASSKPLASRPSPFSPLNTDTVRPLPGIAKAPILHRPGGDWVHLKVYANPRSMDQVVSTLPAMANKAVSSGVSDRWFFIRYADPEPHVRVRLRSATPETRDAALLMTLAWGNHLVDSGLASDIALASYQPEVDRYGGPHATAHIERLFEADSATAIRFIEYCSSGVDKPLLTWDGLGALFLDLTFATYGLSFSSRRELAAACAGDRQPPVGTHQIRKSLAYAIRPFDQDSLSNDVLPLLSLIEPHRTEMRESWQAIAKLASEGLLCRSSPDVLTSLAHMHCNRLTGITRYRELTCYALWHAALESIARRPGFQAESELGARFEGAQSVTLSNHVAPRESRSDG